MNKFTNNTTAILKGKKLLTTGFKPLALLAIILLSFCNSSNLFAASNVTLASATQVATSCAYQGQTTVPIYSFSLVVGSTTAYTLTGFSFVTNTGYVAADVTKFQFWVNSTNTITGATQLGGDITTGGSAGSTGPGTHATAAFSQAMAKSTTYYFFVTANISTSATASDAITVAAIANSTTYFTYSATPASLPGSATIGGTQTLRAYSYTTIPYSTSFESTWTNDPCSISSADVPDANWFYIPSFSNNSGGNTNDIWHRSDYASTDWVSVPTSRYNSASLFNGSGAYSAMFNNFDAPSASQSTLDLPINLSATGNKILTFDFVNPNSSSSGITVLLSTDGGVTFPTTIASQATLAQPTSWTTETFTISATPSATSVVRFLATSDFGSYCLGMDNLSVVMAPTNYYWNGSNTTALSGTWNTSSTNWTTPTATATPNAAWPSASGNYVANFLTSAASTVTLPGTIAYAPANMIIGNSNHTFTSSATAAITSPIALGANTLKVAPNASFPITLSGIISGTGGITNTTGTTILSGVNGPSLYTGTTTVSSGVLRATTSAYALGTGGVTLSGGELQLANASGTNLSFNNNTTLTGNAQITSDVTVASTAGNTYTLGTLAIGANTLTVAAGSNVSSGTAGITFGTPTLSAAPTFSVSASANLTLGALTGAFGITKSGTGTLTLSTTSARTTTAGTTTLSAGKLRLNVANALNTSASAALNLNGGTLSLGVGANTTYNGTATTVGGTATIESDAASSGTGYNQTLGTLSTGAYTLNITGGSNVTSGTAGLILGAVTLTGAPTFNVTNPSGGGTTQFTIPGLTNAGFTPNFTGNGNVVQTGVWAGTGGVTYSGTGTMTLNQANSYTGTTTVSAGTLINGAAVAVSTAGPFGNAASAITLGDANTTTNNSSPSVLTGGAFNIARPITIANQATSGTYTIGGNTTSASTLSGAITINQPLTIVQPATGPLTISGGVTSANGTKNLTFNNVGPVSVTTTAIGNGTGTVNVVQSGAGTTTMSVANTYTGTTTVNAGTLAAGVATSAFGVGSAVTMANASGATLSISGYNNTIGSLTGGGATGGNVTLGGNALTIGGSGNGSAVYAGVISGTLGSIIKTGAADTLKLSGTNTYTGGTTITAGRLVCGAANTLPTSGTFTFNGGDLRTGGYAQNMTTAVLALSASSNIYLNGTSSNILNFGGGANTFTAATTLTIYGWQGTGGTAGTAGRITVGGTALTTQQLSQITFNGYPGVTAAQITGNEIVPDIAHYYWLGNSGAAGSSMWDNSTANMWSASSSTAPTLTWPSSGGYAAYFSNSSNTTATFNFSGGAVAVSPNYITLGNNQTFATSSYATSLSSSISLGAFTLTSAPVTSYPITLSGAIGGTGGFTHNGASYTLLSGVNTYQGATAISSGTLKLGNAAALGASSGAAITSGAVLDLNGQTVSSTVPLALNGTGISSGGALINSSATGATYPGLITLGSAGSIIAGSGAIALSNVGTITGSGFGLTLGGAYTGANSTLTSIIGTVAGTLTKQDAGTWKLGGVNTFTGATTISGGTLQMGVAQTNLTAVTNNATLDLFGLNHTIGSLAGSGTVTSSVTGAITLTAGGVNTSTSFSGTVQNGTATSVALIKAGTGIWTLSGANSYTGITTISAGILQLGAAGSGANSPLGTVTGNTLVNATGAALDLNGFTLATAEPLTLKGTGVSSGGALMNSSSTTATYSGQLTLGAASSIIAGSGAINLSATGTISGATFGLTLGGAYTGAASTLTSILGTTSGTLTKQDAGTWILGGANTYTGASSITGGTLKLGSSTALGTSSATTVSSGAVLDLNGQTIAARPVTLNGTGLTASPAGALTNTGGNSSLSGAITLGSSGATITATSSGTLTLSGNIGGATYPLTLDGATSSTGTLSGVIGTGTGTLTKNGAGVWILTNTANTYTGTTTISNGDLRFNPATAATFASPIVLNGGILSTTGIAASANITSSSTLALSANSTINLGSNAHIITFSGAGTFTGSTTLTIYGWTGTAGVAGTAGRIIIGGTALTPTQLGQISFNGYSGVNAMQLAGGEIVPDVPKYYWLGNSGAVGSPMWDNSTSNMWSASSGSAPTLTWPSSGGYAATFANSSNTTATFNFSGGTVAVAPTYITLGNSQTFATSSYSTNLSSPVALSSYTLTSAPASTYPITLSGIISGTGGITQNGAGTTVLSGTNTYTGNNTITSGKLSIGADLNLGAVPGSVSAASIALGGGILSSTGTFTLATNRGITLTSSTTSSIDVASSQTLTYGGVITGSGNLSKTSTGTLILGGTNSYTGATTINAGTLSVSGSLASGSAVAINSTGTLSGTGTVSGTVAVNSGGTISPAGSGTGGTLTTGAISWYNGGSYTCDITGAGTTACDKITTSSTLTTPGTGIFTINVSGAAFGAFSDATAYTWTIAGFNDATPGAPSVANILVSVTGFTYTGTFKVTSTVTALTLVYTPVSAVLAGGSSTPGSTGTVVIPSGVTNITAKLWGAGGGGSSEGPSSGGSGAFLKANITIPYSSSPTTLYLVVGSGGSAGVTSTTGLFGGPGVAGSSSTYGGGSGGGYSGIFSSSTINQSTAIAIAGGGGGGGGDAATTYGGGGGITTYTVTATAPNYSSTYTGGGGATASSPGTAGAAGSSGVAGTAGSALTGGAGGVTTYGGGGGGGGYYGGGGGNGYTSNYYSSGGGGGSSYYGNSTYTYSVVTNTAGTISSTYTTSPQAPGNSESDYLTGVGNGGNGSTTTAGNGQVEVYYFVTPTTTSISPTSAIAGSAGFTLTVNGTGFVSGLSTVYWNGTAIPTTYSSTTVLTAYVNSTNIASAGTASVTVKNGAGGTASNSQTFTISTLAVTYNANSGTATGSVPTDANAYTYNATVTVLGQNTLANSGYTFVNWYTNSSGTGGTAYAPTATFSITANTTLYAIWTPNSYQVAFNNNTGTGTMSNQSINYGSAASLTSNSFTKTGYTFAHWNTAADGSGTSYADGASYTMSSTSTVTLYAIWTVNSYQVAFNNNTGTGTMSNQSINYGAAASLTTNTFTKTGYTFAYWNTAADGSGTSYADGVSYTMLSTSTVTLYAIWTVNSYQVAFNKNTGAGTMSNQSINYGSSASLTTNTFTKIGFTFAHWNTAANGSGTSYADGASYTMSSTSTVTLYAIWTANNNTITFIGNGSDGGSMGTQTIATGATANLTPNGYTLTGNSFDGWATSSGGSVLYLDGASYTMGTSNVTLYAVWSVNSSPKCPSVTTLSPSTTQTICQGVTASTITATAGYSGSVGTPTLNYQWYYNTTNTNVISGGTTTIGTGGTSSTYTPLSTSAEVGTRYYFCVIYATDNSCTTTATTGPASTPVQVTVNATPSAPTGTASQSFCSATSPTVASLTATGTSIKWYNAATSGTLLSSATALTTATHYYATQTVSGCESSATFDVTATVNTTPGAPTGTASQSFCSAASPTVANLSATGTFIVWYNAASAGSVVTSSTALTTATHYYASQTVSGCESTSRFDVTATVNTTPGAPTGTASQSFCSGASPTVASLSATGTSIIWYNAASAGSVVSSGTALTTATHYYASQTVSGCESTSRLDVTATVNSTPSAPSGSASQSFCSAASPTVAGLSATGTAVLWYSGSTGGSSLSTSTALTTATHYYAEQTVSGCVSSSRFDVTVTINSTPSAPGIGSITQPSCSSATATVALNGLPSGSWTVTATGGATTSGSGTTGSFSGLAQSATYTFTVTSSGCTSGASSNAVIAAQPSIPASPSSVSASSTNICPGTSINLTATSTSGYVNWYNASSGGTYLGTTASTVALPYTPSTSTGSPFTYYAESQVYTTSSKTFSYTGTIDNTWSVPVGVTSITITAKGAQGGSSSTYGYTGGLGATVTGTFTVSGGQTLSVLVGQQAPGTSGMAGGGGGTFVALGSNYTTATPMIVAGGGGGAYNANGGGAVITNITSSGDGAGTLAGTNGNGGTGVCGGGGGGFYTSGAGDVTFGSSYGAGGAGFRQGGAGGVSSTGGYPSGGFGGGATADYTGSCYTEGGAGGGYSGGGGGSSTSLFTSGNGGGSYNSGISQSNTAANNSGNGQVVITWLVPSGCASITRTPISTPVTVTPIATAPTVSTPQAFCSGANGTVANLATTSGTIINWYAASSGGSAITPTSTLLVNGSSYYATQTPSGYCESPRSTGVVANVTTTPAINTPTASVNPTCSGGATTIAATTNTTTAGNGTVGTASTVIGATAFPAIYPAYWYQSWCQFVWTPTELTTAGLTAGNITALTFNSSAIASGATITGFSISMGSAASGTLSAFQTTGLTTVYSNSSITQTATGAQLFTLSTPYSWDGVSNIIVDIRGTGNNGSSNDQPYFTATSGNTVLYAFSSSSNSSFWTSSPTPTASTSRPNIIFAGQVPSTGAGSLTWTWNPGSLSGNSQSVSPTTTTTYTVTGINGTCSSTGTVSVTVTQPPTSNAGSDIANCTGSGAITMLGASMGGGATAYTWSGGTTYGTWAQGTTPATATFTPNYATYPQGSFTATLTTTAAPCTAATSTIHVSWGSPGSWIGVTSTDWNTASNWCGGVPTSSTNVTIPASGVTLFQPTIGSAGGVCNNITINSGATLTMGGAYSLTVSGNWSNSGTFTQSTSTVTFNGTTQSIGGSTTPAAFYNLTTSGIGTITTGVVTTVGGALTVGTGTTLSLAGYAFTVTGTSSITGTLNTVTAATGTKTFTGAVTINSGGVWDLSSQNPATSFAGGITMNGTTFNNGTGAAAFSANQSLAGANNMTFGGTVTPATSTTLTNNNTGTVTVSSTGSIVLTGNFTQGANSTLALAATAPFSGAGTFNANTNANIVNYTGASQTVKAVVYKTLTLSGSGTDVMTSVTTVGVDFNMSGSVTATPVITTVGGNLNISGTAVMTTGANNVVTGSLSVGTGAKLNLGGFTLSIGTTSSITGTVNSITAATGTKTFTGAVTINSGGVWDLSTVNPATSFAGGITMSGTTFNNGTGAAAFSANQSLAGANNMIFGGTVTPAVSTTLTNNNTGTVTVSSIVLTGSFTQGSSSKLTLTAASPISGAGTFDAHTNTNLVTFTGASAAVYATTYSSLTTNAISGTATIGGTTIVNGTMTVSSATTNNSTLTVTTALSGASTLTQGTGSSLNLGGTYGITGLDAHTNTNLVTYTGTSQAVLATTYSSLTINGTGTATIGGATVVNATMTVTTATTNNSTLTVTAALSGGGTLTQGANSTLNIGGTSGITGLDASTNTPNTVNYTASGTQTIHANNYSNITLSGTSLKSFQAATTAISATLSINSGVSAGLVAGVTINATALNLNSVAQSVGTWGNTVSSATYKNNTYFPNGNSGIVNVETSSCTAGTWLGTTSTDWNDGSNWCGGVPSATTNVTIPSGGNQPSIANSASGMCNSITINSGATLTMGTLSSLTVSGNWSNSGTFTCSTSTVTFNSTSTGNTLAGTLTGTTGKFNTLTFNGTGGAWSFSNAADVAGAFNINNGTVTAPSGNLNVAGNWSVATGGTFTNNSGTVTLNGGSKQTIGGTASSIFNNLTISNTTATVAAELGFAQEVDGTLNLTGGNLDIKTFVLTMGATAPAISGTFSATRMIIADGGGEVRKNATSASTANYTFPIGDNTGTAEYSPVTLSATALTGSSGYVGASLNDAKHTNNASTTNYLTRYWNIDQSGFTGFTTTVAATFINSASDVSGTLGSIKGAQLNGAFNQATNPWVKFGSALTTTPITITGATITAGTTSVFTGITAADPTVSASITTGAATVCKDASVILTAAPVGDATFTYSWYNSSNITGSSTSSTATAITSTVGGPTTYSVTVTDGNGIVVTSTGVTVTVNAQPTGPTINLKTPNLAAICAGQGVSATFNSGGGGTGCSDDYTVSIDGGTATAYTPGATVGTGATSSIVIQGRRASCTSGAGCTGTSYVTLASWTVNAQPTGPTINLKTPNLAAICAGQGVSATFNSGGGGTGCSDDYTVSIDGGTATAYTPGATVGTGATSSIVIQGRRASCTSGAGCTGTSYVTLASWTVNAQPTGPTINVKTPNLSAICAGQGVSTTFNAGNGGTGCSDDYTVSIDGGTATAYTPGATVGTGATSSIVIQGRRASCTSGAGCTGTSYVTLASWTVNAQPTGPTINVKTPNLAAICAGQGVSATFNAGNGGTGCSDDYTVSIDGGTATAYTPGATVGTGAASSIVIQGRRASCTSGAGCTGTSYVTLASWTVTTPPTATAGSAQTICSSGGTLTGFSAANNSDISWSTSGDGTFSPARGSANPTYTPGSTDILTGSVDVTMTSVATSPCAIDAATSAVTITIQKVPTAIAGSAQHICGTGSTLGGFSATNYSNITWTTSGSGTFSPANNTVNPTYTPSSSDISTGSVTITMTSVATSPCASNVTTSPVTLTLSSSGSWLGATSSDWFDGSNWCGGVVPSSGTSVTIPSYSLNMPLIGGAGAVCSDLTISSSATLTMNSSSDVSVTGNWSNSGTFTSGGGTVTFGGSSAQSITGATTYDNLYINNPAGVTISNNIIVKSYMELDTGSLNTGSNLVKLDTNAYVGAIGGFVNGNLQQYVPSGFFVSLSYPIGASTNNTPLDLTFNNVFHDGYITAYTTNGDHAQIASSGFDANKTVNRTWTLSNSGVTYDQYSVGLTYLNSDKDTGFDTTYAATKLYSSGSWISLPNGSGSNGYQTASAIPSSTFGDFQIGTINPTPSLYSLSPAQGNIGNTFDVVFNGSGFISGSTTVNLGTGITVNTTTVTSDTTLTANITISTSAVLGLQPFTVTNGTPGGGTSGSVNFNVINPVPTVTSLSPAIGAEGQNLYVTFNGTGFVSGLTTVNVGTGITVYSINVTSSTTLIAHLIISLTATTGNRNFSVTNPGPNGGGTSNNVIFNVTPPWPVANFTASSLSILCNVDGTTTFTNTSTYTDGSSTYSWNFGTDATIVSGATSTGTGTGTGVGPVTVSYSTTGAKTAILTVTNLYGTNTVTKTNYITATASAPATPPASISGNLITCGNTTPQVYTCPTVSGATSYTWSTLPTTGMSTSGQGTISFTVTPPALTSYTVTVAATNACGTSTATTSLSVNGIRPDLTGSITGPSTTCGLTTANYTVGAVPGITSYNWTLPTGTTVVSGQGTTSLVLRFGTGTITGTLSVQGVSTCGTTSTTLTSNITESTSIPANPTSISGTVSLCGSTANKVYACPSVAGATGYTWTIPSGLTYVSGAGTTSVTVTPTSGFTTGTFSVTSTNYCGSSSSTTILNVTGIIPVLTGSISGPGVICGLATANYTVSPVSGFTAYNWTVPAGTSVSLGAGTTSIILNITSGAVSGNISVQGVSACGTSSLSSYLIATAPVAPATILGNFSTCGSLSDEVYTCATVTGATGYNWTVPTGMSISLGQGTSSLTVTPASGFTTGTLSVASTNGCGTSTGSASASLNSTAPVLTGTIAGPNGVCGLSTAVYSVTPVIGMNSYIWTPPTGMTISSGQGTASIIANVSAGTFNGNLVVQGNSNCGNSTLSITISKKPQPTAINGPVYICGVTTAAYNVAPVTGATSYTWLLPTGITMASGTGTNSITVNVASTFLTGSIGVNAISGCGYVTGPTLTVYGNLPTAPTTITGPVNICGLATANYTCSASTGGTGFFWTVPSGMTITGTGQGTSSLNVLVSPSSFTSGSITVAGTNSCGTGGVKSLALTTTTPTPGAVTGPTLICGLTTAAYSIAPVTGATSYNWTAPTGSTVTSGQGTTGIVMTITTPPSSANIGVTANNGCVSSTKNLLVGKYEPAPGIITGPATGLCGMGTATYSIAAVTGATGYTWVVPTGMSITSGQGTTGVIVNSATTATTGAVKVSANNTCGSGTGQASLTVTCAGSIAMNGQEATGNMFSELYPNPTSNEFTIEVTSDVDNELVVEVYDVLGNLLKHEKHELTSGTGTMKTNIEDFRDGIYFVKVLDKDNNILYTQRVIKQ